METLTQSIGIIAETSYKQETASLVVSFAAVFRDVTQRSPERNFLSGERCVTSRKTAAKETTKTRHTTYLSIPIDDFGYRPQIILSGVGRRQFSDCSQKDSRLTLPWMKYFEILSQHYVWLNREFEEFPASFASSKTSYFIQHFGILTSTARIFVRKYYVAYMTYHAPFLRT